MKLFASIRYDRQRSNQNRPMLIIKQADVVEDVELIQKLLREYLDWLSKELDAASIEEAEVDAMMTRTMQGLPAYTPPEGRLLLAYSQGKPAGIVFLKKIRARACEVKRMYVPPEFRGQGVGRVLLDHVIEEARNAGYSHIFLDSASFMQQAQSLYRSRGFVDTDQYPESEMKDPMRDHLVYMCLTLE